jgi:hypothetical protein
MDLVGGTKHKRWDGRSFAENLKNGTTHKNHDCIVVSNCTWTCQRSVLWDNWIMIRTYYTGLKPFPSIMLFDKEKDPHMTKDLSEANQDVVNLGLAKLEKWTADQMLTSTRDVDPMWTVIREGGPYHADDYDNFPRYLSRLRENGRDEAADIMEKYVNIPLPRSEEKFFPMFS